MDNEQVLFEGIAEAGDAIMSYFQRTHLQVTYKEDHSPLTQADLAAQRLLTRTLKAWGGDLPLLCEESTLPSFTERRNWSTYWLVDPLDGTGEFIQGYDHFTVNVALIEGHVPRWGCVYVPRKEVFYYAERGKKAFFKKRGGVAKEIRVAKPLKNPWRIAVSALHGSEHLENFLKDLPDYEIIKLGSSLKICYVAEGKVDLYPRLAFTHEWDTAAAHCVLTAAGGEIIDPQGFPLRYNTKPSLLNPYFLAVGDVNYHWLDII